MLALRCRIEGDLERVENSAPPGPAARGRPPAALSWEAFVAPAAASAYREFNFSPSGEWAAYAFERYREGGPLAVPDPGIAVRTDAAGLELSATVAVERASLRVALCAVIEEQDGTLSYWALRHPAARPDFHHPDGFALELD